MAMELATALHHSAQRPKSRVVEEPSEGEVRETYNAPRRLKAPLPGMRPVLPPEPEPLGRAVTDRYVAAPAPLLVVASLAGDVVDATTVSYLLKVALKQRRQQAFRDMLSEKERQRTSQRKRKKRKKTPRTSSHVLGFFPGFGASHAVFPSIVGRPELPGLMVGMDVKDSLVCYAGLAGGDASCVMFPSVVARPRMLCIMAGMDQKDSTHGALVVDSGSGICRAGFSWYCASRCVPFCTRQAQMLCIMAGMNQKDGSEAARQGHLHPCRGAVAFSYGPDCSADRVSTVAPGQGGRCPLLCRCPGRQNPCRGAEAVSHGLPDHGHSPVAGGDGD